MDALRSLPQGSSLYIDKHEGIMYIYYVEIKG